MSTEVKIPPVGESIASGLLSAWHRADGDSVKAGDPLFTLDTDKVSTEIVAEQPGILRIRCAAGEEVKIGQVVATIEPATTPPAPPPTAGPPTAATPPSAATTSHPEAAATLPPTTEATAEMLVGPAMLAAMAGTGTPGHPAPRITRRKLSPIRRKIAAQLVMAQQTAAILTTFNECDMSAVVALRQRLQEAFQKQHGIKLGFMSFFIKAAVRALQDVPSLNSRLDGDDFIQNHFYDIGVAVGAERGLVVPVVRAADTKSFAQLERDLAAYAGRARDGKLKIDELLGGVFTISNGGVFGSLLSTPILNPPQSGILGLHKIQDRPVAVAGAVAIRPMMYLALSYDHRVVDGKEAVAFLVRVKECIEDPARLLLEA